MNTSASPLSVVDLSCHLEESPCPYAQRKVLTLGLTLAAESELNHAARLLREYARNLARYGPSMFGVQITDGLLPQGLRSLAGLFRYIVHYANSSDEHRATIYKDILSPHWRLTVEGVSLFALALSPSYPSSHHRHTEPISLLLFQPEDLFTTFGISHGPSRSALSKGVAQRFRYSGRPYVSAHARGVPKSLRIVLTVDDDPIIWWSLPLPDVGTVNEPRSAGNQRDSTATVVHEDRTLQFPSP
jgi:hypothetical protein